MLVRRDVLRASKVMAERVLSNPKIQVLFNTIALEAIGNGKQLTQLRVKQGNTERIYDVGGLFYAIGHTPNTEFLKNQIELDKDGYILTKPGTSETSVNGVFAAGDVQGNYAFFILIL